MNLGQVTLLLGKDALSIELEHVYESYGIKRRSTLSFEEVQVEQLYAWLPCR